MLDGFVLGIGFENCNNYSAPTLSSSLLELSAVWNHPQSCVNCCLCIPVREQFTVSSNGSLPSIGVSQRTAAVTSDASQLASSTDVELTELSVCPPLINDPALTTVTPSGPSALLTDGGSTELVSAQSPLSTCALPSDQDVCIYALPPTGPPVLMEPGTLAERFSDLAVVRLSSIAEEQIVSGPDYIRAGQPHLIEDLTVRTSDLVQIQSATEEEMSSFRDQSQRTLRRSTSLNDLRTHATRKCGHMLADLALRRIIKVPSSPNKVRVLQDQCASDGLEETGDPTNWEPTGPLLCRPVSPGTLVPPDTLPTRGANMKRALRSNSKIAPSAQTNADQG